MVRAKENGYLTMPFRLKKMKIDEVSFVDKGANGGSPVLICKRAKDIKKVEVKQMNLEEILAKLPDDESKQALLKLIEGLKASAPKTDPKPADSAPPADVAKRADVPEDIKKRFEEIEKQREIEKKERDEIKKKLDDMNEAKEVAEFEKRASEFVYVPGMQNKDIAKLMRKIEKSEDKELSKSLVEMLKSVNEVVKTSELFKRQGTSRNDGVVSDDPQDVLKQKVKERKEEIRKSNGPKLTDTQIEAQILKEDKELCKKLSEVN